MNKAEGPQTAGPAGQSARMAPVHPGEILYEEFLRPLNLRQYRLAKAIGVDARRIHAIVHGQRAITAETALLLARYFGNSAAFWVGLQTEYDLETTGFQLSQNLSGAGQHTE